MLKRENFEKICKFRTPDRLIFDFCGCPLSGIADKTAAGLNSFLGFSGEAVEYRDGHKNPLMTDFPLFSERLLRHYDTDTRGVGWIMKPQSPHFKIISDVEYTDEWGVRRKFSGLYWENAGYPLRDATLEEVRAYVFPEAETIDPVWLDYHAKRARELYENTGYVVCASHPVYGIFELGCWMFGFDDFLYRLAGEPEVTHCFFQRVLDYQIKVSKIYYGALGKYIHYTTSGDDFATQASTFVSKGMFDELIAPYLKERVRVTKQYTDAKFLHHSCGNVESLIPSLIDCGVDILNPVQPVSEQMSPPYLKEKYKGKIVFHGGYDTQKALLKNTPAQIDADIKAFAAGVRGGGGFILAAAHNIQADVPPENTDAFLTAANKYK